MRTRLSTCAVMSAALLLFATQAHAQATRTWVSGVGDDANPCSRTAPCKTFIGAIAKTAANGEIDALDPGGFGTLTIAKAMTIDAHATHGSLLAGTGVHAVVINAGNNDVVTLRGLSLFGTNGSLVGVRVLNAKAVFIEDCVISGFGSAGLLVQPASNHVFNVFVRNSTLRNNAKNVDATTNTPNAPVTVTLSGASVLGAPVGIDVATQTVVNLYQSVVAGHSVVGIRVAGAATVNMEGGLLAANAIGVQSMATARLSEVMLSNNTLGLDGAVSTFGNNRLAAGNGSDGAFLSPALLQQ